MPSKNTHQAIAYLLEAHRQNISKASLLLAKLVLDQDAESLTFFFINDIAAIKENRHVALAFLFYYKAMHESSEARVKIASLIGYGFFGDGNIELAKQIIAKDVCQQDAAAITAVTYLSNAELVELVRAKRALANYSLFKTTSFVATQLQGNKDKTPQTTLDEYILHAFGES